MPLVPHPPKAAMRAVSASVAGSGALLRGSRGTPSGSGGGSGLSKGPAGVVDAPEPPPEPPAKRPCVAPARRWQVSGHRQRPDCRTPSPPAGPPSGGQVQNTLPSVGKPPPPPWVQRAPRQRGGGGRPIRAESLSGSGLMGQGGQLNPPPPPTPRRRRLQCQRCPQRRSP